MEKSIRVRIMGRKYPLRIEASDEAYMRDVAEFVDKKMRAVRENFPGQPELTSAVIAALSIAEELMDERNRREEQEVKVQGEVGRLIDEIDAILPSEEPSNDEMDTHNNA